jgi:hypothetical protein
MTAELAPRAESLAGCGRVKVQYVDPGRGRERRPLAVRADEPGAGFRVIPGPAELAGLVVILPHRRARRL